MDVISWARDSRCEWMVKLSGLICSKRWADVTPPDSDAVTDIWNSNCHECADGGSSLRASWSC